MAVSSCSQTEDLLPDSNDLQTVTISLAPETGMQLRSGSPGTRAGETISVDRYVMEIYESDNDTPTKETNNTGVFTSPSTAPKNILASSGQTRTTGFMMLIT
ncbi:hypothetical protein D0T85_10195 [Bacteroides sp. 519]|nr:hypothetical protein [Bacteroides sp. 519]